MPLETQGHQSSKQLGLSKCAAFQGAEGMSIAHGSWSIQPPAFADSLWKSQLDITNCLCLPLTFLQYFNELSDSAKLITYRVLFH